MKARLQRALPDILAGLVLVVVPLLLFWPQTVGGRTLLPVDNLYTFQPFEAFAAERGVGLPHNHLLSDLILENYAWKRFIRQSIAAGQLPLWNPYLFAGVPFLAAGQHSALYPFSLIFYVMPLSAAYGWFTVSQLWLAGVNMYVLARVLLASRRGGAGRLGGLLAGLGYQLSGFYLVSVVFPMMIAGAAWLPLELAMIELALRQAHGPGGRPTTLPWVIIGALGLGMIGLAGHVEILYYSLLVMAFYAAWRLVAEGPAARRQPGLWCRLARRAGWLAVMVGLGLALGAVQVMPLAELASRSFRAGAATLAQVRGWAYPWRRLIAFLMPNFFGNPAYHAYFDVFEWRTVSVSANAYGQPITAIDWGIKNYVEGGAYMGLLPLMLAAIALGLWAAARRPLAAWLARRGLATPPAHLGAEAPGRPYRAIFAALGLASFSFVFGTPTYALLYYGLPFINQLHSPFRWVWPLTLSVCVLAAFGVEALRRGDQPEDRLAARMARWPGWGAIWGGVGLAILLVLSRAFYSQIEGLVERVFFGLALAPQAFPDARAFYSYQARQVLVFAALLACSGIVLRLSLCPIYVPRLRMGGQRIPVWEPLAVGILALDLVAASYNFHPAADPALLDFTPPVVEFLRQDESLWRFTSYDPPGAQTMNANSGWFYDLQDVRGYDSLIPKQYADYMALIAPQGQLQYNRIAPIFTDTPQALDSPLLDLLDVRYVLSEVEIDSPKYELVYQGEVRVYENLGAMPRAFTLPLGATVIYDDGSEAFAGIARQYDLRRFVALSRADAERLEALQGMDNPPQGADAVAATITAYTPNEVWIDVQVGEPSWLVLADSNSLGWRAWARPIGTGDDQEVEQPVLTVDGNFRGVTLEPGAWTIRFKYSPDSFKLGAFASFMAGVIVIFAAGVWAWRYAYRESPSDSAVRRVAKNSLAPIVLNLFTRGVDFAFAALMLRIVQPEGAGKFYYAVVIWGWFEIITNFGLNTLLTREVARDKSQAGRYLVNTSLLRLTLVALSVPLLAGFIGLRQTIIQPPLQADTLWVIALLYVGLLPASLATGLTALFYAYEKAEHPASITTVSAIVKASLGAIVLLAGGGIVGVAGVSIITNLVTLGILTTLALRHFLDVPALRVRPDLSAWRGMIVESFPLMLNHLLATLFFKIDVILLETTWGNTVVGWYSTAYKWLDALNIIPSFFTQAIFPVMSRQAHEDPPALLRTYRLAVKLLVMIALPVAVISTLLAWQLIGLLGGAAYLPHGAIALQLMVWSIPIGWINSITNYVLIALNRQRVLTWAFVVGVAFNVTANLIFLPRYSYPAAAIITIFSELTLLIAFYIVLRSALGRVEWLRLLWRPALAATLMAGATLALARTHLLAGLGGGLAIYLVALVVLRPLSADEAAQIAPLLPRPIRARLAPGPSTQAGS